MRWNRASKKGNAPIRKKDEMALHSPLMKRMKSSIDADLQSRQLATYGMSVMERLAGASVLIIGMNGVGVEVAKNIVLANVRKVTLADDCTASWSDMGTHFYLQPDDVGHTNRAEACHRSIKCVNTAVEVVCCVHPITEELLVAHDAVCVCDCVCRGEDGPISFKWNEICRSKGISFIRCEARGVFGYIFDDLSSSINGDPGIFCVPDPGQTIAHVSNSRPAVVTIDKPNIMGSIAGKAVRFSGIQGMIELNGMSAIVESQQYITLFGNERQLLLTLRDLDTTTMGVYRSGGMMAVAPFETVHKFKSFRDAWSGSASSDNTAVNWPLIGDLGQLSHPRGLQCEQSGLPNLHITRMLRAAFKTLENSPGRKFSPGSEEEAFSFVDEICREIQHFEPCDFFFDDEFDIVKGVDNRDAVVQSMRPFFTTFAMSCAGSLSPVAACVGGIAAQEIIKSVACLGDPLSPFIFFSFVDVLPKPLPTFEQVLPWNCRYDSHIAVLGASFFEELRALKVCLVGAGATGCELLKDFAMCGVGTGKPFNVLVADDDIVERSNLSRQFLYRSCDIKKKKAVCAAAAATAMNGDFKARGYPHRVDENTPSTFGSNCDVTIMALDSDVARSVVARRCQCVFRQPQPCLNLGTTGLSLSTDSIIPHITTTYSNMRGPSTAPQELNCQERTVPKTIHHCISLAKRQFELLFVGLPKDEEPLSLMDVCDWNECVVWARMLFDWCNESWVEDVKRQWHASDPIWQGRALPDVVEFDHLDELVQEFIGSAAVLKSVASGIAVPSEMNGQKKDAFAAIARAASSLEFARLTKNADKVVSRITHFEKDDDTNFHVDFVAACANLKARMFHITPQISHFKAKVEAGGILPAISTSTSVASAFTCMDVFRAALHKRAPGSVSFPGRFLHLGHINSTFSTFDPSPPMCSTVNTVSGEFRWTEWETFLEAKSSMTLQQLVDWLVQSKLLPVKSLQYEGYDDLYNSQIARDHARMNLKLDDAITHINDTTGCSVLQENGYIDITIVLEDEGGQSRMALPRLRVALDVS